MLASAIAALTNLELSILSFSKLSAATLQDSTALLDVTGTRGKTGRSEVDALFREADRCRKALDLAEQSLKCPPAGLTKGSG